MDARALLRQQHRRRARCITKGARRVRKGAAGNRPPKGGDGAGRPPYYAWDSRAFLSLVLVGLPELRERLALRRNRSLHSRLHHRLEVTPLTPDDTTEYLRLRMARAGCTREVFASDAIVLLHEATAGAMRDLDRLAANALRETARKKRKLVERDVVNRVIEADTRERDR